MTAKSKIIIGALGAAVLCILIGLYIFRPRVSWNQASRDAAGKGIWNLPSTLSGANLEVTFEVDTSLHLVSGIAGEIEGNVWLEDLEDFKSVRATAHFSVKGLNTGNLSRDNKIQSVMHSSQFPDVIFELNRIEHLCAPSEVKVAPCHAEVIGTITINGLTRDILLPVEVSKDKLGYRISGQSSFKWRDFKIEDPSTFLAKLYDSVKIKFALSL